MNQRNLFETSAMPRREDGGVIETPLARRTDPQTSHAAAKSESVKLTADQLLFIAALKRISTGTAREVAEVAIWGHELEVETIRKRAGELVVKKSIRKVGVRPCKITGKPATVYEVCNNKGEI